MKNNFYKLLTTGESESPSYEANSLEHLNDLNPADIENSAVDTSTPLNGSPTKISKKSELFDVHG